MYSLTSASFDIVFRMGTQSSIAMNDALQIGDITGLMVKALRLSYRLPASVKVDSSHIPVRREHYCSGSIVTV